MKILKTFFLILCFFVSFNIVQAASVRKDSGSCQFLNPNNGNAGCSRASNDNFCPNGTRRNGQQCMCCGVMTGCCGYTQNGQARARDGVNQAECYKVNDFAQVTQFDPNLTAYANNCYTNEQITQATSGATGGCCSCSSAPDPETSIVLSTSAFSANSAAECSAAASFAINCMYYPGQVVNQQTGNSCMQAPIEETPVLAEEEKKTEDKKESLEVKFNYENLPNPLKIKPSDPSGSFAEIAGRVIKIFLSIIGTITVCMIVYGGWTWMTAQGSDSKIKTSRKILTWAAAGVVLIFMAYVVTKFLFEWLGVAK